MSRDDRGLSADPSLDDRGSKWPGVAAVALFGILAYVFANAPFGEAVSGFQPADASIVASIGYAMFNIDAANAVPSEHFLVAFEIIDVVLVAALVGAVMLARREEAGTITNPLRSDAETADDATDEGEVVADGGTESGVGAGETAGADETGGDR